MDRTIIDHERRITTLEHANNTNIAAILERLRRLEEAEAQREADRQQAERRQIAGIRQQASREPALERSEG